MKELERYYEKITPSITAEELTERVISKTEKPKKRISSKFIGIAAAAAAVMTLGVTAAAGGLGYFDVFSNLFGEKAENLTHNILEEAEMIRRDTEKMDFELVAAAADKHCILAIVDITAQNGFKLGENDIGDVRGDIWWDLESAPQVGGGYNCSLIEGDEKSARLRINGACDEDLSGREIVLTIGEHTFSDGESWKPYVGEDEGDWQVKFTATGESCEYEFEDTKISVSPVSITFDTDKFHFTSYTDILKVITETDTLHYGNSVVSSQHYADGSFENTAIFKLSEPINPEEIIALEIKGSRYDLR